ncbi:MAG: holo-ACP synthase [Bacillota bacterium]|nr:holo-ACP synthase [Bacillota bacterium]
MAGIGVDLISIDRIEKVYSRYGEKFLKRIFTTREIEIFMHRGARISTLAACFAAKEAVLKALGCGIGPAELNEVEIITSSGHQPEVNLLGKAHVIAQEKGINQVALSLTHEPPFACAFAVAVSAYPRGLN